MSAVGRPAGGHTTPLLVCADVIHTMAGHDPGEVTGVLLADGLVCEVGTREQLATAHPEADVVDLGAGCVTPGLVDAHLHPILGLELGRGADLTAVTSRGGLLDALRAEADRTPGDGWVIGHGLDPGFVAGRNLCAADLEPALSDRPCVVRLFDAHSAVINTRAIQLSGITGKEQFGSAARVEVDEHGRPTGFLIEWEAMDLVLAHLPEISIDQRAGDLLDLLGAMADSGLAGGQVLDYSTGMLEVLRAAEARTDLPLWLAISPWIQAGDTEERVAEVIDMQGDHGRRWWVDGVKLMIDGTIDNGSAWLDRPDVNGESTGPLWLDAADYTTILHRLSGLGIRTTTHAIGDRGVRYVVEAIATAPNPVGVQHRIEHIETAPYSTLEAMAEHGIAASMQPTHCTLYCSGDRSDNWSLRLGDDRADDGWPLGTLRRLGVPVALGSDWPVAPYPPLPILADAQLRREHGRPDRVPHQPDQALSGMEALEGYTSVGATTRGDAVGGRLTPGAPADLTLYDRDPLAVEPDRIDDVTVLGTVVGGRRRTPRTGSAAPGHR